MVTYAKKPSDTFNTSKANFYYFHHSYVNCINLCHHFSKNRKYSGNHEISENKDNNLNKKKKCEIKSDYLSDDDKQIIPLINLQSNPCEWTVNDVMEYFKHTDDCKTIIHKFKHEVSSNAHILFKVFKSCLKEASAANYYLFSSYLGNFPLNEA